jgi:ribosome maturation factor RimP
MYGCWIVERPKDLPSVDRIHDASGRIEQIVRPILWSLEFQLVEVSIVGQGPRTLVRVFIDKPGGLTLEDCEQAHRSLSPALDVADPFPHAYTLEVSSPGLDRPLRRPEDFRRVQGKRVSVKLKEPHRGQWRITGEVMAVEESAVTFALQEKKVMEMVRFEFERIAVARLDVGF